MRLHQDCQFVISYKVMSDSLNVHKLLNNPLGEEEWPHLESIIKLLGEYMSKCAKNREYVEAQKAKQKIDEAGASIKKRNAAQVRHRLEDNVRKLQIKQAEEMHEFFREWEHRMQKVEAEYNESISKRSQTNLEESQRMREQIELALPPHHSPDDRLKSLRHEEKRQAGLGNFIEAQKIKEQIEKREEMLEEKHRQLRETNIKEMMRDMTEKQERDMKARHQQKRSCLEDMIKERSKKLKELEEKHAKQLKEMRWMHEEEIRMMN